MADDLPTTEFKTFPSSKESLETKEESHDNLPLPQSTIARMFSQANLELTHTQHGKTIPSNVQDLAANVTPVSLEPSELDASHQVLKVKNADGKVKATVISKQKRICSFMPNTINCSDRLTMQKTKSVLLIMPLFLLLSCFFVLSTEQHISAVTFCLIISILITSYITAWIVVLLVLLSLQIIFIIRDAIFWCIVDKWNLEEKKAFIQAYSGVDLLEELDDQQRQLDTLRMLYIQQIRANEEFALIRDSTNNTPLKPDTYIDAYTPDDIDRYTPNDAATINAILKVTTPLKDVDPIPVIYEAIKSNSEIEVSNTMKTMETNTNTHTPIAESERNDESVIQHTDNEKTETMTDDQKVIHQIMDICDDDDGDEQSLTDLTETSGKKHDQTDTMVVHQNTIGSSTGMNVLKLMNPLTPYTPSIAFAVDKYVTPTNGNTNAAKLMAQSKDIPKQRESTEYKQQRQQRDSESAGTMVKKDSARIIMPSSITDIGAINRQSHTLSINVRAAYKDQNTPTDTVTPSQSTGSAIMTPIPQSVQLQGDTMILKDRTSRPSNKNDTFRLVDDIREEILFDEEINLNTPMVRDTEEEQLKDMMDNTVPQEIEIDPSDQFHPYANIPVELPMNLPIDLDTELGELSAWGTSPEEKDAFLYITHSYTANICKHTYRCCPLYKMKLGFCLNMSCELCHSLCIIISIFFWFLTVVYCTSNPIYIDVSVLEDTRSRQYSMESLSRVEFENSGINEYSDIVVPGNTDYTWDILRNIINYEQTFEYTVEETSYFAPKTLQDIRDIIMNNNNKTIRVMGKAMSSSYVLVDSNDILIDFAKYPVDDPIIDNTSTHCVSLECVGTVKVNTSMTIRELNEFLNKNEYVVYGFDSTDDITIGGALGSCSVGPLFGGKSLGYYMVSAMVIDGLGNLKEYGMYDVNVDGVRYLDGIRCNLGLLGVVYQVELEIFKLVMVDRMEYMYSSQVVLDDMTLEELMDNEYWKFDEVNDSIIGKELFINPLNEEMLWILWQIDMESEVVYLDSDAWIDDTWFKEEIFNVFMTPISCAWTKMFDFATQYVMNYGRYHHIDHNAPLTYSIRKIDYFVSRLAYIIPQQYCVDAVVSAKDLANELLDVTQMFPIGITFIDHDMNRSSLIGYDTMDGCVLEIQINACSASRTIFAERFEEMVVNDYNGTGHWGYMWYDYDVLYTNRDRGLSSFESIRRELDPNGVFINGLYAKLFPFNASSAQYPDDNDGTAVSDLMQYIYPRNYDTSVYSFYLVSIWFGCVFVVYLIASYLRLLPFLDSRNLCEYCSHSNSDVYIDIDERVGCCGLKCCNDMNELDELIENEQRLLEQYGYEDNYDKVIEDLIDVEVLDPVSNEYITITVTFKTAFYILMDDENYREFKYREKFAVSKRDELNERYDKLGEELAWKSIYPRQCLFFSSCTLAVAMVMCACIQLTAHAKHQ